ncbi:MAG: HD domain-containing protein [Gemmatimonadaceae bacterium]|nr:HD domain-containing protein [Gemmatimonadaceae bacterium]
MDRRRFHQKLGAAVVAALFPRTAGSAFSAVMRGLTVQTSSPLDLPKEVAGIRLVDSRVARAAVELAREVSPPYLFNHALRTYLFGALIGKAHGKRVDAELLYLACVLHDLGLTDRFAGDRPFEIEGAVAAERFLREQGLSEARASIVWDGIAMHPLALAEFKQPEIALVAAGAGADVVGAGLSAVSDADRAAVVRAFPRLGFKHAFVATCASVAAHHPRGATRSFMRDIAEREVPGFHPPNICDAIAEAPFEE